MALVVAAAHPWEYREKRRTNSYANMCSGGVNNTEERWRESNTYVSFSKILQVSATYTLGDSIGEFIIMMSVLVLKRLRERRSFHVG